MKFIPKDRRDKLQKIVNGPISYDTKVLFRFAGIEAKDIIYGAAYNEATSYLRRMKFIKKGQHFKYKITEAGKLYLQKVINANIKE